MTTRKIRHLGGRRRRAMSIGKQPVPMIERTPQSRDRADRVYGARHARSVSAAAAAPADRKLEGSSMSFTLVRAAGGFALLAAVAAGCSNAVAAHHPAAKPTTTPSSAPAAAPSSAPAAGPSSAPAHAANPIPQGGGGDGDADNNGGPSDGDGNI
jgi:hypothetical protein